MTTADLTRRVRASRVGRPLAARLLPRLQTTARSTTRSIGLLRHTARYKVLYLHHLRTRLHRGRRVAILAWLVLGCLAFDALLLGIPRVGCGALLLGAAVFGWQWASRPATTTAAEATAPSGT
ncbi:hypothetical protein ACIBKX_32920 [Streptomyces sp. NPDC050658]|uniref:hypothetical protein n=1 Tax=unclassified Streptomyces TaxID=2593676 RepID=UPI0034361E88